MNTSLYQKITDPETCREDLRGIFVGDGYLFATNGFIAAFEKDDGNPLPAMQYNPQNAIEILESTLAAPTISTVFDPELLRTALEPFGDRPVTVSISAALKEGYLLTIENKTARICVMSMRAPNGEMPKWKAATK